MNKDKADELHRLVGISLTRAREYIRRHDDAPAFIEACIEAFKHYPRERRDPPALWNSITRYPLEYGVAADGPNGWRYDPDRAPNQKGKPKPPPTAYERANTAFVTHSSHDENCGCPSELIAAYARYDSGKVKFSVAVSEWAASIATEAGSQNDEKANSPPDDCGGTG